MPKMEIPVEIKVWESRSKDLLCGMYTIGIISLGQVERTGI